jgi:hypothetical protein
MLVGTVQLNGLSATVKEVCEVASEHTHAAHAMPSELRNSISSLLWTPPPSRHLKRRQSTGAPSPRRSAVPKSVSTQPRAPRISLSLVSPSSLHFSHRFYDVRQNCCRCNRFVFVHPWLLFSPLPPSLPFFRLSGMALHMYRKGGTTAGLRKRIRSPLNVSSIPRIHASPKSAANAPPRASIPADVVIASRPQRSLIFPLLSSFPALIPF